MRISDDRFDIRLNREDASGGEARTLGRLGGGTFQAVIRCADAPGSLCAFFLYEGIPGDENDEIDIEVFNDGSRRAFFNTWVAGVQTNFKEVVLPFDPTREAHVYRIERRPDAVTMLIDGVEYARFTERLPTKPLHVYLNAWWPVWLTPEAGADPAPRITVSGVQIDAPLIDHPPSPY